MARLEPWKPLTRLLIEGLLLLPASTAVTVYREVAGDLRGDYPVNGLSQLQAFTPASSECNRPTSTAAADSPTGHHTVLVLHGAGGVDIAAIRATWEADVLLLPGTEFKTVSVSPDPGAISSVVQEAVGTPSAAQLLDPATSHSIFDRRGPTTRSEEGNNKPAFQLNTGLGKRDLARNGEGGERDG